MNLLGISTFFIYFCSLILVAFLSHHRQKSDTDFVIGNRSLNFWLTALSAHASDMSNWLFMGYPAVIFMAGLFNSWAAIGLTIFMFLNWHFIAPKIRIATGKANNLTLNAFFESRFSDSSGIIRTLSALMSLIFFVFYISAGLVGLGLLVESLFGLDYIIGISIGLGIVVFYVFLGGYTTVAWIDLVQGFFLLGVILFIPIYLIPKLGGFSPIFDSIKVKGITSSLFPDFSIKTFSQILLIALGWGLGYLGQPHIITKFMGIKKVTDMYKAKYLGISWQILTLGGATLLGMIGILLFPEGLQDPELVALEIVKSTLSPIFAGLVLCAILAATTNVMAAQILVVASSLAEDFYKRLIHPEASHKAILKFSRISVIATGVLAYFIAFFKISSIYQLVLYSWSGLGSSFGPLLVFSLYSKKVNKYGAFAGILTGGITAGIWPYFNKFIPMDIPSMIPGFILSTLAIFFFSIVTQKKITL